MYYVILYVKLESYKIKNFNKINTVLYLKY